MDFLVIKSKLKKYLPSFLYNKTYFLYKYFNSYILGKNSNLELVKFTKPLFKEINSSGIHFNLKINPDNGLVDKEIYMNGVWEPEILQVIRDNIGKKSICLDIGANIGQHTLFMASIAKEGAVYSFEPLQRLVSQIEDSILVNNITNVTICNFGLSNTNESKKIYLDNLNIGRSTFDVRKEASSIENAEIKIFDDFWKNGNVDFIKMDVEGYEYYALQGMTNLLSKYSPILLIEFTPFFMTKWLSGQETYYFHF